MTVINFIRDFSEIKEKDDKYYLFLGIISGLDSQEILAILDTCLTKDIFKRKILINKTLTSAQTWVTDENDAIFEKVYSLSRSLDSYFKKESASLILVGLWKSISKSNQNKLLRYFLHSNYKNNRKRAYLYLQANWSFEYQKDIEKIWKLYEDEEIIELLVSNMPENFLLRNKENILNYFEEEYLEYNLSLKVLRNKFYARIYKSIPSELKILKIKDPISYIFIMKESDNKIDPLWAIEIYKNIPTSRKYLPRWFAEMNLWEDILKNNQNILENK